MTSIARKRIDREIGAIKSSNDKTINIDLIDNSKMHLQGTIFGPEGTPYQKGIFKLDIIIPENYPFVAPKVKFITKIWHPNMSSQTGAICLDTLKDAWAAALSLRTVLLSITSLLNEPQPNDPQDAVVASQFNNEYDIFKQTAHYWTMKYANAEKTNQFLIFEKKLQKMLQMGFTESESINALSAKNWVEEDAIMYLSN